VLLLLREVSARGQEAQVGESHPLQEQDLAALWPAFSRLLATAQALVSVPEKLPVELPATPVTTLELSVLHLTVLTEFLQRGPTASGSATAAPRD
jgi:hypothetical protein